MTAILRVRDENGNVVDIPAIKGKDGADGYTPIKGIDYFDGAKGDTGEQGAKGKDGYTPVKGTDYFTETDKNEIVAAVKNQLITEQWTFTLTDDTVITKDVLME